MDDDLKRIAARIRTWRAEAGLTLQKLGDRSGVSASTIHKIENLQTVPTISVLLKVANGLNRRPSELLDDADEGKQVAILRSEDRRRLFLSEHAEIEHLIGMTPHNRLDVWRIHLKPGAGPGMPGTDAWKLYGEVVVLVEDGCIDVDLSGESHMVEAGDSIHFDSKVSHRWVAGRNNPATVTTLSMIPEHLQLDVASRTDSSVLSSTDWPRKANSAGSSA